MLRTSVQLRRVLGDELREHHDLSMADYDALVQLADQPGHRLRMAELAETILQPRSSLTRIVDGLVQRGLVLRERSSDDARGAEAVLTDAGLALFRRAQRTHHDAVRRLFLDRLTDDQLQRLADVWRAVGA
jgi:DNA-binding MarR family transcriptional regulator